MLVLKTEYDSYLISTISSILTDSMKKEVRKAPFAAVMLGEVTDITNVSQMSYVPMSG